MKSDTGSRRTLRPKRRPPTPLSPVPGNDEHARAPDVLRLYDTHVHVWAMDPQRYPWHPILARAHIPTYAFTAEQLIREMDLAGVERAVLVQPSTYGWDHRYLFEVLAGYPDRFRGVVLADPADPRSISAVSPARGSTPQSIGARSPR